MATEMNTEAADPVGFYSNDHFKVRVMLTARYVWMAEQPDGSLKTVDEGTAGAERRHAVLRAGVEARYALPLGWDGLMDVADVAHTEAAWHTLDVIEFAHPVIAPAGHEWHAVVEGETFRLEHTPVVAP